jgi:hypothetical protein
MCMNEWVNGVKYKGGWIHVLLFQALFTCIRFQIHYSVAWKCFVCFLLFETIRYLPEYVTVS